ncbi:hypothetical protein [Sediminicoccus sp. KRV36]|uniref:hypothetical protein n=1 Tax=Sediminicoccus sp. KRV36 TaxID=3133721 RepID=UPI00200BF32B|nr:hypothetical protein [Sediminicoccus rosea]UPY35268.1 hypothetical protein LHU95_13620 [Sediminicoccus rosea]
MQPGQGQPQEWRIGARRAVIVHAARDVAVTLELAAGQDVALLSAPGAAAYLGVAGFAALLAPHGALGLGILDAADAPGHALAALRAGFACVVLAPHVAAFPALAGLAQGMGARLLPSAPPALDLARVDLRKPQGRKHLARWLDLA